MKKLLIISFLLVQSQLNAQSYYTGWDNTTETNGWIQFNKGDVSHPYEWEFDNSTFKSPDNSLVHYYPVGGTIPTDNWFISPVFDFYGGGQIDTLWKNYSGFGIPVLGDSIALYLLNGSTDPDLATKTLLYNFTDSTYIGDAIWSKDSNITIPPTSGNSYLAFRYYTTNNWLDVKFDNLYLTYTGGSSQITEFDNFAEVLIYPNPTKDYISFNFKTISTDKIKSIHILDSSGRTILSYENYTPNVNIMNLNNGKYFVKIETTTTTLTRSFQVHK